MKIKASQIYSWDEEPVDERPSEFMSTTGYSGLSGYHTASSRAHLRHSRSRFGFKSLIAFCLVLLGLGAFALVRIAPMLRG